MRVAIAVIFICGLASSSRAEEGGRTVIADPALAFGEWNERVQLDLPPAANNTKPDVAIVASHRAVDTEVGSGWRLQAGSVIRRRSLTNGVPSTSTNIDDSLFHLDGIELVKVPGPGGTHYQPETYDGSRIEFAVNSNVWVRKRDGWIWTYGGADASRFIHTSPFSPPAPCGATAMCNTESWFLQRVVDPYGNRIEYAYSNPLTPIRYRTQYSNHGLSKDFLIASIKYGGTQTGALPVTVSFTYEDRPDTNVDMSGGMPTFRHRRLKKVISTTPSATGTSTYSRYILQYEDEAGSETEIGPLTDCDNEPVTTIAAPLHSLLRKIHRSGSNVSTQAPRVIRCNKYNHDDDLSFDSAEPVGVISNPFLQAGNPFIPTEDSWKLVPAELDGDGRTDLIMLTYSAQSRATPHQVYVATPNQANQFTAAGAGGIASQTAQSWQTKLRNRIGASAFEARLGHAITDMDADGVPEILTESANGVVIDKAQGTGVLSWTTLANNLENCDLRYGELVDINGDRLPDFVVRAHGSDGTCFAEDQTRWIKNSGAAPWFDSATAVVLGLPLESLSHPQPWQTALSNCQGGVVGPPNEFLGDTDGDGIADDWTPEAYVADQARFDDVNSDGITDVSWALYACWQPGLLDNRWHPVSNSIFSRVYFGKGDGLFTDSGLTAGPPLLLDMRDWGGIGNTRMTTGTFAMTDLDRDGRAELISSSIAQQHEGLGLTASSCVSFAPPGTATNNDDPWEVGFGIRTDQIFPFEHEPQIASYVGSAWYCHEQTVTPAWGDFDGDGFLDMLVVEGNAVGGLNFWQARMRRSSREIAEGRLIETDNEHGGRTRLTWGFSAQQPNVNPYLSVNLEVIQEVMGPGGTRSMTYRDGLRRGDQVTAFAEVTVRGDRGGTEVYSFITSPAAMGKQLLGVRYRENALNSIEHVTVLFHGQITALDFVLNLSRPYFNPLARKCEFDTGFAIVDIDTLIDQCRNIAWAGPNVPVVLGENTVIITPHNQRMVFGHDVSPDNAAERADYAKIWGAFAGSRTAMPRMVATPAPLFDASISAAFTGASLAPTPGIYWPVPAVLAGKIPDVIGQEAAYVYPGIGIGSPQRFAWDWRYDLAVRKLMVRYEHRDLATIADDRRVDFAWEQPQTSGYWYRLLSETTKDGQGAAQLTQLVRSGFTLGFDSPETVKRCGLTANDCSTDRYTYDANGTVKTHTLPDNTAESWTRVTWCGEPLSHTDAANRVTTYTRDDNCLPKKIVREGATTSFTYDHLLRPVTQSIDPGAGVSASKVTYAYFYDDALTYQANVGAREDWNYTEPRKVIRRGDGQLELVYQDGLGRTTRRTECADSGVVPTTPTGFSCTAFTKRHLEWNLYGNDGLRKIATAPFADGETPTTTGYGHDGQGRAIIVLEPVHEPSQIAWRVDLLKYTPGQLDRIEPTSTGALTTRRTSTTLSESISVAGIVRNTIARDRLGLVTKVVEADGTTTALGYDGRHRLASETRVDVNGQPLQQTVIGTNGQPQLASYIHTITARDGRDRVTAETLTDGSRVGYTYDNADRILTRTLTTTALGTVTTRRYTYTPSTTTAKGKVTVTDELGGMTSTALFDGLGRTWSRTASRVNDQWTYDTSGRRVTATDIDGIQVRYFYDIHDTLTSVVDPRTGTTTYNRDGSGRPTSIVDADGATESFQYVYSGALFRRYRGSWLLDELDYDPRGQVVNSVEDGVAKTMTYDTLGRLTKLREGVTGGGQLRVSDFTYDAGDRLRTVVRSPVAGALTATTTYQYDTWGRPYAVDDPTGRISREFDLAGRVRRTTDQAAAVLETRYDDFGRVIDQQVPGGGWQHFAYLGKQTYNGESNLWRVDRYDDETLGVGERTQRYTDGTGHTVAELRPDGTSTRWTWNKARVTREELRNGATVHRATDYAYDANGRLQKETRGNYVANFEYTAAGRPWKTTTPDDLLERQYTHGLLSAETQAGVTHRYLRGPSKTWVTTHETQRGSSPRRSSVIERDDLGRITSARTSDGAAADVVASYSSYDFYGNPFVEQRTIGATNVLESWTYDRVGRPLRRHTSGTGLVGNETIWGWYANGVLGAVQTPSGAVIEYDYGANPAFDHQLDAVKLDGVVVARVDARDARGAITLLTLPSLATPQKRTFAYDLLGRTTHRASGPVGPANPDFEWDITFHPDGKIHTELVQDHAGSSWENVYTYDAAGRLDLEVSGKTHTTLDYVLDAAGNRTSTIVTPASPTYASMTATYDGPKLTQVNGVGVTYNNWNEVSADHHGNAYSRNADGQLAALTRAGQTTVFARNARGLPIAAIESIPGDNIVGTRRTTWRLSAADVPLEVEEADGNVLTYIDVEGIHVGTAFDGTMTNVVTDHRGTELKHGAQTFGLPTSFGAATTSPTNSDERFMYAMLERVPSANQVMLARLRTYDPITGRFLEPDPIGAAGGLELYQYGNGDPVNFVDPMGTTPVATGSTCPPPAGAGGGGGRAFTPISTQIHELLGSDAPPSMDEIAAPSGIAQNAYLSGVASGVRWITEIDVLNNPNPFGKGPLCVVNCGNAPEETGEEQPASAPNDSEPAAYEITVYGKRLSPDEEKKREKEPGYGKGCAGTCGEDEDVDMSRKTNSPIGGSELAKAFAKTKTNRAEREPGRPVTREAVRETVKAHADEFVQAPVNEWNWIQSDFVLSDAAEDLMRVLMPDDLAAIERETLDAYYLPEEYGTLLPTEDLIARRDDIALGKDPWTARRLELAHEYRPTEHGTIVPTPVLEARERAHQTAIADAMTWGERWTYRDPDGLYSVAPVLDLKLKIEKVAEAKVDLVKETFEFKIIREFGGDEAKVETGIKFVVPLAGLIPEWLTWTFATPQSTHRQCTACRYSPTL